MVISTVMFEQLTGSEQSLVDFMRRPPLYGDEDIPLERDNNLTRTA